MYIDTKTSWSNTENIPGGIYYAPENPPTWNDLTVIHAQILTKVNPPFTYAR